MTDHWQINVACPLLSINRERSMHFHQRAAYVKVVRALAANAARETGIPPLPRARMVAQPLQKRGPLADILNHVPTLKAAIDGFVDAGILPDDAPQYLPIVSMRPPILWGFAGIAVVVYLLPSDPLTEGV